MIFGTNMSITLSFLNSGLGKVKTDGVVVGCGIWGVLWLLAIYLEFGLAICLVSLDEHVLKSIKTCTT